MVLGLSLHLCHIMLPSFTSHCSICHHNALQLGISEKGKQVNRYNAGDSDKEDQNGEGIINTTLLILLFIDNCFNHVFYLPRISKCFHCQQSYVSIIQGCIETCGPAGHIYLHDLIAYNSLITNRTLRSLQLVAVIQIGIVYFSQSRLLSIQISRWPRRWHTCYFANMRAFLVAWWIRILLPTQGTWVQSLVQEDSACWGATKPANLNYWAHTIRALEPQLPSLSAATSEAHAPESLCSTRQATAMRNPPLQWRVAPIHNN